MFECFTEIFFYNHAKDYRKYVINKVMFGMWFRSLDSCLYKYRKEKYCHIKLQAFGLRLPPLKTKAL